jgi:putative transposase
MKNILNCYRYTNFNYKYSHFAELDGSLQEEFLSKLRIKDNCLVRIIAYCIMPTHIHIILQQLEEGGISKYMSRVLNSYTRYFNTGHGRNGPLWSGRFKSVLVSEDEQLLHLTRYIHLNPTSADMVKKPEQWGFSSYNEYLQELGVDEKICDFDGLFDLSPKEYAKFVNDRKDYQKQLSIIKSLMIDNYSG